MIRGLARWGGIAACLLAIAYLSSHHLPAEVEREAHHARKATLPGITLDEVNQAGKPGLVVTSLRSEGSAEQQGLRVGDRLEDVDGRKVTTLAALRRVLGEDKRARITLDVRRGTDDVSVRLERESVEGGHGT